ncbi:TetR/AcrR family transcriptional regulator [Mumia zhuanghuii]|uniref:TetR/AcrR family transcriptional regulator n=1 Tax=Mumia zhuanghuii TaxID=2585211 RepID=UPI003641A33C
MIDDVQEASAPRRADALRNIATIVEAATRCLADDPDVSMNAIAKAAGVGRMTLYGHFPSRATLVAEVVDRALRDAESTLGAVDVSGDPMAAIGRLLDASLRVTYQYGGLVQAAEQSLSPDLFQRAHAQQIDRMQALLKRGRRGGQFRRDLPLEWQVTTIQSILHTAATAVHQGTVTAEQAPTLVTTTVLAMLAPARPEE